MSAQHAPGSNARTVEDAVADCYYGYRATAAKRGRNPRWPYVPIVMRPKTGIGRPDLFSTEQLPGKAFEHRADAVGYAQKTIDFWTDRFRRQLQDPRMRALRDQWGVAGPTIADARGEA